VKLGGELETNEPPERVRRVLTSPEKVATCLPHIVSWEAGEKGLRATFRVNIGGVVEYLSRLTARANIEIREIDHDNIDYVFEGTIARAKYSGVIHVHLDEKENGTRIQWSADVELGKTLQLLSRFINVDELLDKIVKEVTESMIKCVEKT